MRILPLRSLTVVACAVLLVATVGGQRSHAALSLADLLVDGASLTVDNLTFDQFTYSATGNMPSASGLNVLSHQDAAGNYGIRLAGGMVDIPGSGPSTFDLGYRVSVLGDLLGVASATLAGNTIVVGQGSFNVTESFAGLPTTLNIFGQAPGAPKLLDSADLPSTVSSLNVQVAGVADVTTGAATASFIDQTFGTGEADNVVPEPASFVIWLGTLMLLGIVPVTYRRWRLVPESVKTPFSNR